MFLSLISRCIVALRWYFLCCCLCYRCYFWCILVNAFYNKKIANLFPIFYRAVLCRAWYCYGKSSVCPSLRNVEVSWSHNFVILWNLVFSHSPLTPKSRIYSKRNTWNLGWNGVVNGKSGPWTSNVHPLVPSYSLKSQGVWIKHCMFHCFFNFNLSWKSCRIFATKPTMAWQWHAKLSKFIFSYLCFRPKLGRQSLNAKLPSLDVPPNIRVDWNDSITLPIPTLSLFCI